MKCPNCSHDIQPETEATETTHFGQELPPPAGGEWFDPELLKPVEEDCG